MEDTNYVQSPLAKKVDRLLSGERLFADSEESTDIIELASKPRNEIVKKNRTKKTAKKAKSNPKHIESASQSTYKHSWLVKDNYSLRARMREMQRNLTDKEQRIKNLYKNIFNEREEIRTLTTQVTEAKQKDLSRLDLKDRIRKLQQNEAKLMVELTDQQEITRDAITKLYELQEESFKEFERIEKYYQGFLEESVSKQQEVFENKLEVLKHENQSLSATIKNYQDTVNFQVSNKSLSLESEISNLKGRLNFKSLEFDKLKQENLELKKTIKEKDEDYEAKFNTLKNKIKQLEGELLTSSRLAKNRNYELPGKSEIIHLKSSEKEANYDDSGSYTSERTVHNKIDTMSQKLQFMQQKLQKTIENDSKIPFYPQSNEHYLRSRYQSGLEEDRKDVRDQKKSWQNYSKDLLPETRQHESELKTFETRERYRSDW